MHYWTPQTHPPLWLAPPLGLEETAVFLSTISWTMLPRLSCPRPMLAVGESWCSHQGNRGYHPHQGASQIPSGAPSTSDRPKAWPSPSVLFHNRPRYLLSELIDIGHARKSTAYVGTDESANQNNPLGVHGHSSPCDLNVGPDSNHNAPLSSPRFSTPFLSYSFPSPSLILHFYSPCVSTPLCLCSVLSQCPQKRSLLVDTATVLAKSVAAACSRPLVGSRTSGAIRVR